MGRSAVLSLELKPQKQLALPRVAAKTRVVVERGSVSQRL
jgi:hypothetical protein